MRRLAVDVIMKSVFPAASCESFGWTWLVVIYALQARTDVETKRNTEQSLFALFILAKKRKKIRHRQAWLNLK